MTNKNTKEYYEWGEWPELLLYKSFWLNTDAKVHKLLEINPNEIIDLKGHYLWEKEIFETGKKRFKENFEDLEWLGKFTQLADELTTTMLQLQNSSDIKTVFEQAAECLSCSEVINLFDHAFMELLEDFPASEKQEIFDSIHPKANTHIMQLQEDIRDGKDSSYLLKTYPWVGTHGFEGDAFSKSRIDDFRTQQSFEASKYESYLVEVGSELAFYRSYIVETVDKILFSIIPHLEAFASDNSIRLEDVYYLTPEEILNFNGNLPSDIEGRKKAYGLQGTDKGLTVWTGDVLREKMDEIIRDESGTVTELKGMIAFKGKVTGKARIIIDKGDLEHIEEGDIIISNETTPEYVVAMKKAAAIVTNLGGITSHAAIVAREMSKPCITGTKIATKVFKNGDMVEVDADNGVIKILK